MTNYNQILRDYYNALTELETALETTLPAAGFVPDGTSVLPDAKNNPNQNDRAKFLKSIETVKIPQKNVFKNRKCRKGQRGKAVKNNI